MDLSKENGRDCSRCLHSRMWQGARLTPSWSVCVEPAVWEHFKGPRDCGEIARHQGPCGPDGGKFERRKS